MFDRMKLTLCLMLIGTSAVLGESVTQEQLDFFEKKIRPVLADNCFSCHGPEKQHSGLRLDSRETLLRGGDGGPVIVPGKPDESTLISAVRYQDYEMPPKGKLDDATIAALTEWVRMGAPWPDSKPVSTAEESQEAAKGHWSFQPITNPPIPKVKQTEWVRDPLDHFVLARLEAKGLTPSEPADRRTLIRRATIDLTGLPPTPEEIEAFLRDESKDAFAKVVDRLLDSPRYGERWGRHWLDVARYADTKGYVFQEERRYPYSYTYRDYVINAFNEDLPIDQFIMEQLAADLMPQSRGPQALAAMGFLTVGRRFLNNTHDIIDDQIDVTTRGLMGLTVACARCHDHKYDPVPTADYYSLYGVFASSYEPPELPELPVTTDPQTAADFAAKRDALLKEIEEYLTKKQNEYREKFRSKVDAFLDAAFVMDFNPRHGKRDELAKSLDVEPRLLEAFVQAWKNQLTDRKQADDPIFGVWNTLSKLPADQFASKAPELLSKLQEGNQIHPLIGKVVLSTPPASMQEVVKRYGEAFVEAVANLEDNDPASQLIDTVATIPRDRLPQVFNRRERDEYRRKESQLENLKATHPGAPPRAMVMNDRPQLYNPYVFVRGTPGRRGESVPRRFLEVLSKGERKPFEGSGRLQLAEHIVSKDNPLTARVFVNRVWGHHFGLAIVRTPSDFGLQGEEPTHPELLDHLAWTFREDGWSLKRLHRKIMLSATYQQRSEIRPDCQREDPENRLIWRQNRRRLDFESMRDSMLFVARNLDETRAGRSVDITSDNYSNRRTVYGFIDRQNLDPIFRIFDLASPNASTPQRFVTTVPQQALFLMNSRFLNDQARMLAEHTKDRPLEERLHEVSRTLFGRQAEPDEIALAKDYLAVQEKCEPTPPDWQYGFGKLDEEKQSTTFQPLTHFGNGRWQFGDQYPHPKAGHLSISASSGHPGPNAEYSVILRWTAPAAGTVNVGGVLHHKTDQGDGVHAYVVSSRGGVLGKWSAHNRRAFPKVNELHVERGESIDFIVAPGKTNSYDSYEWAPTVRLSTTAALVQNNWDAKADFRGPLPPAPTAWQLYVQALLMSNEFCFVD